MELGAAFAFFCKGRDMRQSSIISYAVCSEAENCPEERSDGGKERTV